MRTKQIQIFKFNELNNKAKEKAIEDLKNDESYLNYDWYNFLFEEFGEELEKIGVSCESFNFEFYREYYIEMNNPTIENQNLFLNCCGKSKKIVMLENLKIKEDFNFIDTIEISINDKGSIDVFKEMFHHEEEIEDTEELLTQLETILTDVLQNKLNSFLKRLQDEYDYLLSDEAISEFLEANEYEFLENGESFVINN